MNAAMFTVTLVVPTYLSATHPMVDGACGAWRRSSWSEECLTWVKSSPARRLVGTAEVPHIADEIAAAQRTVGPCKKLPSAHPG